MKKNTLIKFLLLLISLSFTSCHGAKSLEPFVIPHELDTSKEIELTFWAKNDTNKIQTQIYNKAIETFESFYPNIKVNIRLYTNYGDIYNDVITNISTNTTPNICITYPDHIATYMTGKNIVVPLDSLMTDEKYGLGGRDVKFDSIKKDEIVSEFLAEGYINNTSYALPFMRSTEACYINKDFVEKLGYTIPETLTWDFVWEVSEKAMEKDKNDNFLLNGQKVLIPFIYKSTDNMMIQLLRQKSYDKTSPSLFPNYSSDEGDILLFNDTTKSLLETIAEHSKNKVFSTFKISSYPANFLNAGQCIFAIDSTAGATWMGYDAPLSDISEDKLVPFTTEVRSVPQFDINTPQMISQGPSICIFNKTDPQEVLASWLFTQYLLTNEVQISYAQTEGYLPVTTKAQESYEYQEYLDNIGRDSDHYDVKIKASRLLMDNIDNTFTTPVFNGSTSLRDASGQLIENTVKGVRRNQTIDDAFFDKLFTDVKSLFRLEHISGTSDEKEDLGPLPLSSIILLLSLAAIWLILLCYYITKKVKTSHKNS